MCVCVCVCVCERESVCLGCDVGWCLCVCVCVRERERVCLGCDVGWCLCVCRQAEYVCVFRHTRSSDRDIDKTDTLTGRTRASQANKLTATPTQSAVSVKLRQGFQEYIAAPCVSGTSLYLDKGR